MRNPKLRWRTVVIRGERHSVRGGQGAGDAPEIVIDPCRPGRSFKPAFSISAQMRTWPFTGSISGLTNTTSPAELHVVAVELDGELDRPALDVRRVACELTRPSARSRSSRNIRRIGWPGCTHSPAAG